MKAHGFKKALLRPLMVVAGDHAVNDMADEENPEPLAAMFIAEGLGQMNSICLIYKKHVDDALDSVTK